MATNTIELPPVTEAPDPSSLSAYGGHFLRRSLPLPHGRGSELLWLSEPRL
jgi:hypothetical protein